MSTIYDQNMQLTYTLKDLETIRENAKKRFDQHLIFRKSIALALDNYMKQTNTDFNELQHQLGISSLQLRKILDSETNSSTFMLFRIGDILGKEPKVVFE
ncbi:hypothetical protein L3V83_10710 [Thiotrichales bacterium 19X7-9]|nr:hypothetical protein [Thiotrichales bacterium 19X7-9]